MNDMNNETINTENNDELTNSQEQDMQEEQEQDGQEDAGVLEASGETETVVEVKEKPVPAHLAFVAAAQAHAQALGLAMKDQKGFFQISNAVTGNKLYIAKQGKAVTRIDTTLPVEKLEGIALPLDKPNGRITCHVQPTLEAVTLAIDLLATYEGKIPAPKKAAKAETVAAAE